MSARPVADDWFVRRKIDSDITLLWEPHVHELLRCNIWHIRGRDRDLLVDTGLGVASLRTAARDLFEKPLTAVLTHAHMDHAGGAHEFDDVCIHCEEEAALAQASNHIPLDVGQWSEDELAWMSGMGYDIKSGLLERVPYAGFEISLHHLKGVSRARTLKETDVIDLGDRSFEVLHLPGHSPGSIGLWEKATGTLFAGDAIYDGPLLDEIPGSEIDSYVRTMRRLRELPVSVVHAGHEHSFGRSRLCEIVDDYLSRRSA